jgi:hypothetical protein
MGMLPERELQVRRILLCSIGVMCLCVAMYMLGSTMTLWTMEFVLDQTDSQVLEGFSLPTPFSDLIPAMPVTAVLEKSEYLKKHLNEHALLRPPNTTA